MTRVAFLLVAFAAACGNDEHVAPIDAPILVDAEEGGDGCESSFACTADADKVSICGHLFDTETDVPIQHDSIDPLRMCDPNNPTAEGPCALRVRLYDAATFAANPTTATPITPPAGIFTDGCSRFKAENVARDQFDMLAVVVDDAAGVADTHRPTAVAFDVPDVQPSQNDVRAYSTRIATDVAWSTPVFDTGMTFAERGALAFTFTHHRAPTSNLQVQRDGAAISDDDYYFTDVGVTRSTISTTTNATGPNGTVLVTNASMLATYRGVGAEPPGCVWPSHPAITAPGVVFIHLSDTVTSSGDPCP